jgi:hypothetical protein
MGASSQGRGSGIRWERRLVGAASRREPFSGVEPLKLAPTGRPCRNWSRYAPMRTRRVE